jgi:hypothetical protein
MQRKGSNLEGISKERKIPISRTPDGDPSRFDG